MTEGLRERTEEQKAAMHPGAVSPAVVWIASLEVLRLHRPHCRGGQRDSGHRRGLASRPDRHPEEDPTKLGPIMMELQAKARKNAGMNGVDLD